MGQKVNPIGLRVGIIRDWESKWIERKKNFADLLIEDAQIRRYIKRNFPPGSISRVEIERSANRVRLTIHTAKPGIVIGRGGKGVDDLRARLERRTGKSVSINIQEIKRGDLDAQLVAENIAVQIEKRIAFKRAMRQALMRAMKSGAKGIKVTVSGRLAGSEMARRETYKDGKIPLHTLRADIDYGFWEAATTYGNIGIKVWIYKGDILPERPRLTERLESVYEGRRRH
ncbi:MAG: 30S ribosomal protein S3 [Armatimonadota bacterium]|nr:30S ribosomal protein S3 [Armatimonadota bacterium]